MASTPSVPSNIDEPFTERTSRIVNAAKLHRAAVRRKTGRFLAEGENSVTAALRSGKIIDLFVTAEAWERFGFLQDVTAPMHFITDRAANYLAETVTNTGLFALCESQLVSTEAVIDNALAQSPLISVPVETREPGNAGTIVRVSDAFGAGGVLFAGETVDPLGGKAVRASAGSVFNLPVARNTGIADVVERLHEAGFQVLATAADGDVDLAEIAMQEDSLLRQPTAWLFGNEAHGLGEWIDLADVRVSIPMRGNAESLNLATAASVCLYESAKVQSLAARG